MKTDLENMVEMLESVGYKEDESGDDDTGASLGKLEYEKGFALNRWMIVIGPGASGDEGGWATFYFDVNGKFVEHGCNVDEDYLET